MPDARAGSFLRRLFRRSGRVGQPTSHECPVLVSSAVTDYCITHHTTGCAGMKWSSCRFRQLFYFENPMDEHTILWADGATIPELGPGYRSPWEPMRRG